MNVYYVLCKNMYGSCFNVIQPIITVTLNEHISRNRFSIHPLQLFLLLSESDCPTANNIDMLYQWIKLSNYNTYLFSIQSLVVSGICDWTRTVMLVKGVMLGRVSAGVTS